MRRILHFSALLAAGWTLCAQPAARPSFEVASVKPSPANCGGPGPGSGPTPGRLELPCVTLRNLIRAAYGTFAGNQLVARQMEVLGGPGWIDTDRYNIEAKAEGGAAPVEMVGPMLQTLLEERFQLKVHAEARETPVFALTVSKGGPKLTRAKEGGCEPVDLNNREQWSRGQGGIRPCGMPSASMNRDGVTTLETAGATMEEFAGRVLQRFAGRLVVDQTGLTGRYDIRLEFAREMPAGSVQLNGMPQPAPAMAAGPSIFTAVQEQLGLRLAADKAPVKVIVVDSVQRPSAN